MPQQDRKEKILQDVKSGVQRTIVESPLTKQGSDAKKKSTFSPKQKRAYHRIMTGLYVAERQGCRVMFLTLTSSPRSPSFSRQNDSFRKLKQSIQRLTPLKLLRDGYIRPADLRRHYPDLALNEPLMFEYFKVHTNEGHGVFHVLYKGYFIPRRWLKAKWEELHNAWNVNIQRCWKSKKRVAGYIAGQYLAGQDSSFTRYSKSKGWYPSGCIQKWQWLKRWQDVFNRPILEMWHDYLDGFFRNGVDTRQIAIDDYG
ncbi:MAG TPA: hypothetical protein ENN54_04415 [Thermoplasmatales archaeon]|nr:hypothetical protein [Thermoplasmatales archaeon]